MIIVLDVQSKGYKHELKAEVEKAKKNWVELKR